MRLKNFSFIVLGCFLKQAILCWAFLFVCLVCRLSIASSELASLKKLGGCDDLVFKLSTQTRDKRAFLVISRHSVSTSQLLSDNFLQQEGSFGWWSFPLAADQGIVVQAARTSTRSVVRVLGIVRRCVFLFFSGASKERSAFHAECVRAGSERSARTDRKRVNDRCLGAGERRGR